MSSRPDTSARLLKKVAYDLEKCVELIVVHPVPSIRNIDALRLPKGAGSSVLFGVGGPTLGAADQKCRTRDAPPEVAGFVHIEFVGRMQPDIVVKFPRIGAVFIARCAVQRQVIGLLGTEMLVGFLHALDSRVEIGVAARVAPSVRLHLFHPALHALMGRAALQEFRRWP